MSNSNKESIQNSLEEKRKKKLFPILDHATIDEDYKNILKEEIENGQITGQHTLKAKIQQYKTMKGDEEDRIKREKRKLKEKEILREKRRMIREKLENPKTVEEWHEKINFLITNKKFDEAIHCCYEAMRIFDNEHNINGFDDLEYYIERSKIKASFWAQISHIYYLMKKYDKALSYIKLALKCDSSSWRLWNDKIWIYSEMKDWGQVYVTSSKALNRFPNNPTLLLYKGFCLVRMKRMGEAEKCIKDAMYYGEVNNYSPQFMNHCKTLLYDKDFQNRIAFKDAPYKPASRNRYRNHKGS